MKKSLVVGLLFVGLLLNACAAEAPAEVETVVSEPVLALSGLGEAAWTVEELQALTQSEAEYINKDGETTLYSGVAFADLLAAANVSEYAALSLISADGYSAEVTSEELSACASCIVAIEEDGGLRSVLPDFSSKLQVKDLVEIAVK